MSEENLEQLTLFAGASHARIYLWLDIVLEWLGSGADSGLSLHELLRSFARNGSLSKMSPAFSPLIKGETWEYSPEGWPNSAIGGPTGCLTLSTSEWPKDAVVCSLSDILQSQPIPPKYYLSQKAAKGILRRAEKRGKSLPPFLQAALEQVAQGTPEQKPK